MPHILLTGAGFTRNWGGWLSNEVFEYLLGCPEMNADILAHLWKSKNSNQGFEHTLQALREEHVKANETRTEENIRLFERMIEGMFNSMNNGFLQVLFDPTFNPNKIGGTEGFIGQFLSDFEAIFTLNQDCFLELQYSTRNLNHVSNGRWRDLYSPGLKKIQINGQNYGPPGLFEPASKDYQLEPSRQPYFKLHGSCNWRAGDATMLIMGGDKAPSIDKNFLLRSYRDRFIDCLGKPNCRLVIIGYSFQDQHINSIIANGVKAGTKIFIIDAAGIDVLGSGVSDGIDARALAVRHQIREGVLGASRRRLLDTFSNDVVERAKIKRFLNRLGPEML